MERSGRVLKKRMTAVANMIAPTAAVRRNQIGFIGLTYNYADNFDGYPAYWPTHPQPQKGKDCICRIKPASGSLHRLVRPGLAYAERVLLAIYSQPKEVVLQQLLTAEKPLRLSKVYLERDAPLGSRPLTHRNYSTHPGSCRRLCAIS